MPSDDSETNPRPTADNQTLEEQAIADAMFSHNAMNRLSIRLRNLEAQVAALEQQLQDKALLEPTNASGDNWLNHQLSDASDIGIEIRAEDAPLRETSGVHCEERLPYCRSACCRFSFALSATEVEAGLVKWNLGAPYRIRQRADGVCVHSRADKRCGIYQQRPGVCKSYDCSGDQRIWKDFDNMVPNTEWIEKNLGKRLPMLVGASMLPARKKSG